MRSSLLPKHYDRSLNEAPLQLLLPFNIYFCDLVLVGDCLIQTPISDESCSLTDANHSTVHLQSPVNTCVYCLCIVSRSVKTRGSTKFPSLLPANNATVAMPMRITRLNRSTSSTTSTSHRQSSWRPATLTKTTMNTSSDTTAAPLTWLSLEFQWLHIL